MGPVKITAKGAKEYYYEKDIIPDSAIEILRREGNGHGELCCFIPESQKPLPAFHG